MVAQLPAPVAKVTSDDGQVYLPHGQVSDSASASLLPVVIYKGWERERTIYFSKNEPSSRSMAFSSTVLPAATLTRLIANRSFIYYSTPLPAPPVPLCTRDRRV